MPFPTVFRERLSQPELSTAHAEVVRHPQQLSLAQASPQPTSMHSLETACYSFKPRVNLDAYFASAKSQRAAQLLRHASDPTASPFDLKGLPQDVLPHIVKHLPVTVARSICKTMLEAVLEVQRDYVLCAPEPCRKVREHGSLPASGIRRHIWRSYRSVTLRGDWDAKPSETLSYLVNLERLEVQTWRGPRFQFLRSTPKLKHLTLHSCHVTCVSDFKTLLTCLPAGLETLELNCDLSSRVTAWRPSGWDCVQLAETLSTALQRLDSLTALHIRGSSFGDAGLAALCPNLPTKLSSLSLTHFSGVDPSTFILMSDVLRGMPYLQSLSLQATAVDDTSAEVLSAAMPQALRSLDLSKSVLSVQAVLRFARRLPTTLQRLVLHGVHCLEDADLLSMQPLCERIAHHLHDLRALDLTGCLLQGPLLSELLASLPGGMEEISITGNYMTEEADMALARQLPRMRNLRVLSASRCLTDDARGVFLERLPACLEQLFLASNRLGSGQAQMLAHNLPQSLKVLVVGDNEIGFDGMMGLVAQLPRTTLTRFEMFRNGITASEYDRIVELLPPCIKAGCQK